MKAINVQHSLKPPLSEIIFNEYAVKGSGLLKTILPPCNKMNVYRQTEHTARLRWGIAAEKLLWQFRVIKWTGTNDLWVWGMSLIQNYFRGKCCSCCRAGANGSSAKDKMWQARGIKCDVWKWKWVTRQATNLKSPKVYLYLCARVKEHCICYSPLPNHKAGERAELIFAFEKEKSADCSAKSWSIILWHWQ